MYLSKRMMIRAAVIISVCVVMWSVWKRIDSVVDTYHQMYMLNQGQQMVLNTFKGEDEQFNRQFDQAWNSVDAKMGVLQGNSAAIDDKSPAKSATTGTLNATDSPTPQQAGKSASEVTDTERLKDQKYNQRAVFKPTDNMPVPRKAEEATAGYYQGLLNLFVGRMFIARYVFGAAITLIGIFFTKRLLRRVDAIIAEKKLA